MNEELSVKLEYKDLEAEMGGEYDSVWKSVNKFLNRTQKGYHPQRSTSITVKGKINPEIIFALIERGYFDQPKTTDEIYSHFEELGKTDLSEGAIRKQLKNFVEKGKLIRKKGRRYLYLAPWSDTNQVDNIDV